MAQGDGSSARRGVFRARGIRKLERAARTRGREREATVCETPRQSQRTGALASSRSCHNADRGRNCRGFASRSNRSRGRAYRKDASRHAQVLGRLGLPDRGRTTTRVDNLGAAVKKNCGTRRPHWTHCTFEADGVVVKVDRRELKQELGTISDRERDGPLPGNRPDVAVTRLIDIKVNVGRMGPWRHGP